MATTGYAVADQPFRSPLFLRWTSCADVADVMVRESVANRHIRQITCVSTGSF